MCDAPLQQQVARRVAEKDIDLMDPSHPVACQWWGWWCWDAPARTPSDLKKGLLWLPRPNMWSACGAAGQGWWPENHRFLPFGNRNQSVLFSCQPVYVMDRGSSKVATIARPACLPARFNERLIRSFLRECQSLAEGMAPREGSNPLVVESPYNDAGMNTNGLRKGLHLAHGSQPA